MNDKAKMDAYDRMRTMNDRAPRISTELKIEVAKFPPSDRPHAQEVAEVLEEILRAAEKNLPTLPPRRMYGPRGELKNQGEKQREDQMKSYQEWINKKEEKRKQEDKAIK